MNDAYLQDTMLQSSENENTHLRYNMELQRTRLLRRLKADVLLLEAGLQALTVPVPKPHVTADHIERVLDAMRQEIKTLISDRELI